MYHISVPVVNELVTDETRERYLEELKAARAERVLLIPRASRDDDADLRKRCDLARRNADFFRAHGIEAALWVSNTIGHGTPLAGVKIAPGDSRYQTLVNMAGDALPDTRCPFDERFRKSTGQFIADLAKYSGVKLIFLDDDFRLSQHGSEFCCACELHMTRIRELCGEDISRAELKKLAFGSKVNKYREAWLTAQRESLELLAKDIRAAVDEVDPDTCVALCAAHSIWGVDGSSATEIATILAGKNRPVARLHPAPYSSVHSSMPLSLVFEMARMFAHFAKGSGCEIIAEGDTYPRPRYNTPSSYLELFDAVIRADGQYDGMLKYMIDYSSHVDYETGYVKRHVRNLPLMEGISEMFDGKTTCGVSVPVDRKVMEYADFEMGDAFTNNYPFPSAARMMAQLSIPTTYEDGGVCVALFGENARRYPLENIRKGAILDAVSARILTERGVDVGLCSEGRLVSSTTSTVSSPDDEYIVCIKRQMGRFLTADLHAGCEVKLYANVAGEGNIPFVYRYENAAGQRFTVYLGDTVGTHNLSALNKGYYLQTLMTESVEWIAGARLPASCAKNPDLYMLCKKTQDGRRMAVGLFNCFADSVLDPVIRLDGAYSAVRFVGCNGTLCGDTVMLDTPIGAYAFAAFEVEK